MKYILLVLFLIPSIAFAQPGPSGNLLSSKDSVAIGNTAGTKLTINSLGGQNSASVSQVGESGQLLGIPHDPFRIAGDTNTQSSTITSNGQSITFDLTDDTDGLPNLNTVSVGINGTYGGVNLAFKGTMGGVDYALPAMRQSTGAIDTSTGVLTNITDNFLINVTGFSSFKITSTAYSSGTQNVRIQGSSFTINALQITPTPTASPTPTQTPTVTPTFSQQVVGNIAHDGIDSGNPVKIGGKASNAMPAPVSNGDRTDGFWDLIGRLVITLFSNQENWIKGSVSTTGASSTQLIAASGDASLKNCITDLSCFNTGSTTSQILIQDGSGGTTIWSTGCPAGSGSNKTFNTPICGSANTATYFQMGSGSTTNYISASGFKSK